ncbi:hypothetical protein PQD13_gp87 [Gordonia phage Clawz]|uniref:Uncharacterized protein n=1 Tax=Gordonia phage Clawz TaxID=2743910 RepID=A0AAE7F8H8_9CAUD|nr:hypothetical protein PQD13_gp87 [Gordonia phage Clawz]QKY79999.1 hypothetical protein SEA_CLAWZ_87 [Gordonia phage Clawz]
MPLYDTVLRTDGNTHQFLTEAWDDKARRHEPVGLCSECQALLYGDPAYSPDYGSAVYREMTCQRGHSFVATGSRYRTPPIPDPDRYATSARPGEAG